MAHVGTVAALAVLLLMCGTTWAMNGIDIFTAVDPYTWCVNVLVVNKR